MLLFFFIDCGVLVNDPDGSRAFETPSLWSSLMDGFILRSVERSFQVRWTTSTRRKWSQLRKRRSLRFGGVSELALTQATVPRRDSRNTATLLSNRLIQERRAIKRSLDMKGRRRAFSALCACTSHRRFQDRRSLQCCLAISLARAPSPDDGYIVRPGGTSLHIVTCQRYQYQARRNVKSFDDLLVGHFPRRSCRFLLEW